VDEVTDGTFSVEVLESAEPVIVDFWAPWCKPCDAIEPHLVAIAEERGVRLVKLNVDESLVTPSRYGVLSLPTVILFADGEPRATVLGAQPRSRFEQEFAAFFD
jgi:thioredoxin 1